MASFSNNFNALLASVVENCDEISSYICDTIYMKEYMKKEYYGRPTPQSNNSTKPFEYLREGCSTQLWDEFFSHVMDLWDADRMSGIRLNALIERLNGPAARLDVLVPRLERECQRLRSVPKSVPMNARVMQTRINIFLNSADVGLSIWKKRESE